MKNLITVTYKTPWHGHHTHYAKENRYKSTRLFTNKDEARAFAETVEVVSVRDYTGKAITL